MESLRWILLAVGAVFVLVIWLLGRSRRARNQSLVDELDSDYPGDLPEFSARSLDDVDEGVGQVRVVRRGEDVPDSDIRAVAAADVGADDAAGDSTVATATEDEQPEDKSPEDKPPYEDIIVLYILAKPGQQLSGAQINSSAQAMGLSFGEMNIFHYLKDGRKVFSMANMLKPGAFDPETIHEMKTTGLSVFMQIQADGPGADPLDDLTEMLQRSYQLAGLLDARLCNHKRKPLIEQDAENYRAQVRALLSVSVSS